MRYRYEWQPHRPVPSARDKGVTVPQRITLADIAREAGVSTATVSRVLNGKATVASSTRHDVLVALDMLGYERPATLSQSSHGLVGLVVPELSNPIFPIFTQAIEQLLVPYDLTPLLCTQTPGGFSEDQYIATMVDRGVSGIIFVSGRHADTTADLERYHRLREHGIAVVTMNGNTPGTPAPGFATDDRVATRMAVDYLLSLGHRRIGLAMGPSRMVPALRKKEGFEAAMAGAGPQATAHIVATHYTHDAGAFAAGKLLDAGCTAIICGSDVMALGAIQGVRQRGLSVPEDVSVVGYDDSPLIAITNPALTTVRQPVTQLARAAVSTLLDLMSGAKVEDEEMTFMPELIVRGSTGAAPR